MPCVLIVEDDPDTREALHDLLVADGHTVRLASDGARAVQDLLTEESPGVVVLDTQMPRMDAQEFLDWLASQRRFDAVPVIVASAETRRFEHPRATVVVRKPYEEGFLALVRKFCG